jgi:predicted regulator of Ras-like GTPase activity (Roadblock/LC7/MglB family)
MLDDTLQRIREGVEAVRGAWLVGLDGIPVAGSAEESFSGADDLAATFADLFRKVRAAQADVGRAEPAELIVGDADGFVVIRAVTAEYALVGVVGERGSLGRLRFEFRKVSPEIAAEVEA